MCGIAGLITSGGFSKPELEKRALSMNDTIRHRGPDDQGIWVDEEKGIALAQRRLSIIDLSPAGHQPMVSACGRWIMVYNGETYSNQELKPHLEAKGIKFRGHSDTEVMLEACAAWGVEEATKQFIGMFAFALWDRQEQILYIVRDRLGIKPLYWAYNKGTLLFASELKALCAYPEFEKEIDRSAVATYLRYGYIPAPHTIYKHVRKLAPATIMTYKPGQEPTIRPYWVLKQVIEEGRSKPFHSQEPVEELHDLLKDAVGRRMVADVPLGAFLSGGIDSSLVVSLMQAQSQRPIKTFTIGFDETGYNEAPYAKRIAEHLGTDHTELYVTAKQAQDVIPNLAMMYDEPFADASQIPTFLVSKLAREHVTVALSGDGGDELFAGYNRYLLGEKLWRQCTRLPARRFIGQALSHVPRAVWVSLEKLLPKKFAHLRPADRAAKITHILRSRNPQELYLCLISQWMEPRSLIKGHSEILPESFNEAGFLPNFIEEMQYIDTLTYLPDDILTKVDRASMAVSLEARVPLLDHRVVAWAWQQPMNHKVKQNHGKVILKQVLEKYVPSQLFERPKMGFGVPIDHWLRGSLRDWAEDLLSKKKLGDLLEDTPIRQAWQDHIAGKANHQYPLWTILMLQAWREMWER